MTDTVFKKEEKNVWYYVFHHKYPMWSWYNPNLTDTFDSLFDQKHVLKVSQVQRYCNDTLKPNVKTAFISFKT